MKVDRGAARRRVMSITVWAAAGAAALTAGLAFGAAHNSAATATPTAPSRQAPPADPGEGAPQAGDATSQGYGFTPPSGSSGPPAAMSGGS